MARVNEEAVQRETFGAPAGWSDQVVSPGQSPAPAPEAEGVPAASPQPDVEPAPSAEQTQEPASTEQAPPQPAAEPEPGSDVPFNKHPRWIERQQELERERQRAAELQRQNELLLQTMQRVVPQPQAAPQVDPWVGLIDHPDPATAQFYQNQKRLMEYTRMQAKQEAIAELQPVIQAGMQKLALNDAKEFRKENPDIKPGSEDERQIMAYMNGQIDGVRHPLESAKRNVVFNRLEAENRAFKSKQAAIPSKARASQAEASSGMPATNGLPAQQVRDVDRAGEVLDKGGTHRDVFNAFFGMGRK